MIISDNASSDNTQKICLEYIDKDSRIQYFRNQVNEGAIKNFNKVLKLATGEYFMWSAYDDLWEPTYISSLVNILNKSKEISLAFSMFNAIDADDQEITSYPNILDIPADDIYQRLSNYLNQFEALGKANLIYGLMRKQFTEQAFVDTSHFLENNVWGSDMLFVFQILSLGNFWVVPENLFHKRILPCSPSNTIPEDWKSYFLGYEYLIKNSKNLNDHNKKKLMRQIWQRKIFRNLKEIKIMLQKIKNTVQKNQP